MTMYDMTRVNANGYFDSEDTADARYEKKAAMNKQRTENYKSGNYALAGGVVDPLPEDAPQFVRAAVCEGLKAISSYLAFGGDYWTRTSGLMRVKIQWS